MSTECSYFANNRVGRFDYGYDALNRRIYEQRDFGLADGFQYDATDQIIGYQQEGTLVDAGTGTVSSAVASTLQFGGAGNRTQITGSFEQNTYVRNKLNQYAHDAAGSAGYDEKGNLARYAGWVVTYDAQNRMTRLEHAGTSQVIIYKYDALNRRIAQSSNGVVRGYVFDNWNRIEERPTDGRQAHCYLFGGAVNEVVVSFGPGYHNYWYFQDGRGNTSHLTDNDHVLLERYTYSFDGRVSYFDGNYNPIANSPAENRFLFAGAILLPETSLYDMRNRIYYPRWGRFLQTDPIGFQIQGAKLTAGQKAFYSPGGVAPEAFASSEVNLYRYCHNDPINKGDPMGLMSDGYTTSQEIQALHDDPKTPAIIVAAGVSVLAAPVAVEAGLAALAIRGAFVARATLTLAAADKLSVQFGRTANQLSHTFRHTDKLGLNRTEVQTAVRSHLSTVASQVKANEPLNKVIEVGGQKIQYTAYRLKDGTISVGRIHGL